MSFMDTWDHIHEARAHLAVARADVAVDGVSLRNLDRMVQELSELQRLATALTDQVYAAIKSSPER